MQLRARVLLVAILGAILLMAASAQTNEIKLRFNQQDFPGSVVLLQEKHQQAVWIELEPLASRIGWARHPGHGGWCLRRAKEADGCNLGDLLGVDRVYLEGKALPSR